MVGAGGFILQRCEVEGSLVQTLVLMSLAVYKGREDLSREHSDGLLNLHSVINGVGGPQRDVTLHFYSKLII